MTAAILAVLVMAAAPQQPAQPVPAGTAGIRGQVTDAETGAPLPRALVTLRFLGQGYRISQTAADQEGRFEFLNLAAGRYEVTAAAGEHRGGYLQTSYRDPANPQNSAPPTLTLTHGEVRNNIDMALPRSLSISGRVVDEFGDPLAGVMTRLVRLGNAPLPLYPRGGTTDDLGRFRQYGVAPGRYVLCTNVQFNPSWRGGVAAKMERFVDTCYPSALDRAEAETIVVGRADLDGLEIRMRRSRAFSISGRVVDSLGLPVGQVSVNLTRYEGSGSSGVSGTMTDGEFLFNGLLPGDYSVSASIGLNDPADQQRGQAEIQLTDSDIDDVVIALKKPATVHGRVVFEDIAPSPTNPINIAPRPVRSAGAASPRPAQTRADHTFTLENLFGPMHVDVLNLPRGWVLKSVRYRGQDVTGTAVEFSNDAKQIVEIELTSRVASVTGSVVDDMAKPAAGAMVLLFPADPRRWTRQFLYQYPRAGVGRDGRFTLQGIAAGDYLLIAVAGDQSRVLSEEKLGPKLISKYAERVSLVENDRLTMNLRVVTLPEPR